MSIYLKTHQNVANHSALMRVFKLFPALFSPPKRESRPIMDAEFNVDFIRIGGWKIGMLSYHGDNHVRQQSSELSVEIMILQMEWCIVTLTCEEIISMTYLAGHNHHKSDVQKWHILQHYTSTHMILDILELHTITTMRSPLEQLITDIELHTTPPYLDCGLNHASFVLSLIPLSQCECMHSQISVFTFRDFKERHT